MQANTPLTGDAAPTVATSPQSVIDQTIDRDHSLLMLLVLQCVECGRHGAAKDGGFVLYPGGVVYCRPCEQSEAHS